MALTTCKACGNSINATSKDCTYCGLEKKIPAFVKYQIVALVLLFIVTMLVVKNTPRNPPTEQPVAQRTMPTPGALFDIPFLAGKTQGEVEALIGEAVFCAKSESALNCSFQENEIEIVFIDGKADWITINGEFRSPAYRLKLEGKTNIETLKLLGDPVFCAKSKSALHCAFKEGDVSVEFVDGKADDVVVKGKLGKAPYDKEVLKMLGLPVKDASFSNKHIMRWENIPGLLSVTLHSVGNTVSLATVKVKTK